MSRPPRPTWTRTRAGPRPVGELVPPLPGFPRLATVFSRLATVFSRLAVVVAAPAVATGGLIGLAPVVAPGQPAAAAPAPSATTAPTAASGETSGGGTSPGPPPLESLLPSGTLESLPEVPPGTDDGPLTASVFGRLSADPASGTAEFEQWSSQSGFGAWIRTWKDQVARHSIQYELFQFPTLAEASDFAEADTATFSQVESGQTLLRASPLPGLPGSVSIGVSFDESGTPGLIEGVLFRVNRYVCIVNTVAVPAPSPGSPATLPAGTASQLAQAEAVTLSAASAALATTTTEAPRAGPSPAIRPSHHAALGPKLEPKAGGGGVSAALWLLLVLAVAVLAALGASRFRGRGGSLAGGSGRNTLTPRE